MTLTLANGEEIQLGASKHQGGEGKIYEHPRQLDQFIKIYREPTPLKAAKLDALIQIGNDASPAFHQVTSWPLEQVYLRERGTLKAVGFTMRRALGVPIHTLYGPKERKMRYPHLTWKDLVLIARNAAAAFHQLHATGAVLGDINEGNFVVDTKTGLVSLIDCDSYQVTHSGQPFLCPVGVGIWTPPEMHGVDFKQVSRTVNHDSFGLAVLLFQLLFIGRHPFASSHEGDLDEAIRQRLFSYADCVAVSGIKPPPLTLIADDVGQEVFTLFDRAFLAGSSRGNIIEACRACGQKNELPRNFPEQPHCGQCGVAFSEDWCEARPPPEEWYHALDALVNSLVPCSTSTLHLHREGQDCPFCRLERGGYSAFVFSGFAHKGELSFDEVVRLMSEIEAIRLTPFGGASSTTDSASAPSPSGRRGSFFGIGSFLTKEHRMEWEKKLAVAQGEIAEAEHEIRRFLTERQEQMTRIKRHATKAYQNLLEIPNKEKRELQELEQQRRPQQMKVHLKKFTLPRYVFDSFKPGLDAKLTACGVETPYDVINKTRPAGIPVDLWTQLLKWSEARQEQFVFDHQLPIAPTALLALKNRLQRERIEEQVTLSSCYQSARNLAAESNQLLESYQTEFRSRVNRAREAETALEKL